MTSFSFGRPKKDRAATRFMSRVHRALVRAALQRKKTDGLSQRALAERLEVDKAMISRIFSGRGNPTIRTLGELFWALEVEPDIIIRDQKEPRQNEFKTFSSNKPTVQLETDQAQPERPSSTQSNSLAMSVAK